MNKLKYLILFLFVFFELIIITSCSFMIETEITNVNQIGVSIASKYQEDFIYLVEKIRAIHPSLTPNEYKYVGGKEYENLIIEIYNQLSKIKENDVDGDWKFYYLTSKLISKLNDGHTYLTWSKFKRRAILPIVVKWFDNELYVIKTIREYKELLNKKVLKLGNIDVGTLRSKIYKFIPADNNFNRHILSGEYMSERTILELLNLLDESKNISVEYESENEIKTISLPTKRKWDYDLSPLHYIVKNIGRNKTITKYRNNRLWFKSLPEYKTMYLQIQNFSDAQIYNQLSIDYREEFKKIFTEIKEKNLKYLIIDLRDNPGGYNVTAHQLLSYIKNNNNNKLYTYDIWYKPSEELYLSGNKNPVDFAKEIKEGELLNKSKGIINLSESYIFTDSKVKCYMPYPSEDLHFNGELYILTKNNSYSMAAWFAAIVKDNGYGTIIGEPTGGASISHVKGFEITLPNTKLIVNITGYLFVRALKKSLEKEPDAVYPDVYIPTTFEDYLNGIDPCWEYLVENVFNKENE